MARNAGKPPVPKYHYKLVTVSSSRDAQRMEAALRDRLRNLGLTFFTLCRSDGTFDVMGDSGASSLAEAAVANARAVAAETPGELSRLGN
jgi:hypothetical protein